MRALHIVTLPLLVGLVATNPSTSLARSSDSISYIDTRISNGGFGWGVGGDNPGPQYAFGSMRLGPDTSLDSMFFFS